MRIRRQSPLMRAIRGLLTPMIMLAAMLCFTTALGNLDSAQNEESLRQLERALRRGCVACYAAEGSYPTSLEYLQDHYGIQIDGERYAVYYDLFASNLMPDITVLERH